jgi:hypothetical protein
LPISGFSPWYESGGCFVMPCARRRMPARQEHSVNHSPPFPSFSNKEIFTAIPRRNESHVCSGSLAIALAAAICLADCCHSRLHEKISSKAVVAAPRDFASCCCELVCSARFNGSPGGGGACFWFSRFRMYSEKSVVEGRGSRII